MSGIIERLEAGERSNELDVLIECALKGCRANNAGTKVIYTESDGSENTHWARDWSLRPDSTISALKARGV